MGDRLFVAVALDEETRGAVEAHLAGALAGKPLPGRAVVPRNWHFTLRFLGDTPAEDARRLRDELRATELGPPFEIGFARLGAFPRPARAAVLWVGVGVGTYALRALAARVDEATGRAGFPRDPKPFAPHLTIARVQPPRDVRDVIAAVPALEATMRVVDVVLYRSTLGGGPPRYEVVERFPLG
jgi:RNA 2',3'-cyclic 3'-phosphodiesterase